MKIQSWYKRENRKIWLFLFLLYLLEWLLLVFAFVFQAGVLMGFIASIQIQSFSWFILVSYAVIIILSLFFQRIIILACHKGRTFFAQFLPEKRTRVSPNEER
jgi:uncharacterized membrane protein